MYTAIPTPLRAAAGLAAVVIDEARRLPRRVVTAPVMVASVAMQASLKAQQRYTELTTRGDQLLAQLRGGQQDDTPPWARFDEDETEPHGAVGVEPDPDAAPVAVPVGAPLDNYDELTVAQLRGRLRRLTEDDLLRLIDYERAHANRAPYVTMLENRLTTLRG